MIEFVKIGQKLDDLITTIKDWVASNFVKKSGDTMTGQLLTSFKNGVAMGSYGSSQTTIPNLCSELRYSSGACGSANLAAYTKGVTIAAGWYNFLWIPHRSGGVNGAASGDNCNHGSLFLSGMTVSGAYIVRYTSSDIAEVRNLYADSNTTYSAGTGISLSGTTFSNSGATGVKGNNETSYRTGNVNLTPANLGIGTVYSHRSANPSLGSGKAAYLSCFITIPAGTYIIRVGCEFSANANGRRAVSFNTSNSEGSGRIQRVTGPSTNGGATNLSQVDIHTTTGETLYVWGYQNSGTTLNVYPYITAIKIA